MGVFMAQAEAYGDAGEPVAAASDVLPRPGKMFQDGKTGTNTR